MSFFKTALPLLALAMACCAQMPDGSLPLGGGATAPQAGVVPTISEATKVKVGEKIWRNECGGTVEGLTSWNVGEAFGSFGIGHFIWYPANSEGPYEESFPGLVDFLAARQVQLPPWLHRGMDCPWPTRGAFEIAVAGGDQRIADLRHLLRTTTGHQTDYIIARLQAAVPKMVAGLSAQEAQLVRGRFGAVAETGNGLYALIDYVNFKGEGTSPTERYQGLGWGLAQVLEGMDGRPRGQVAVNEFAESAKRTLSRRVANAPKDESRWVAGWHNRCDTYKMSL